MHASLLTRRRFLTGLGALGLDALWSAARPGPARAVGMLDLKEKAHWRMVVPWSPDMDLLRRGADRFARRVSLLTQSRLAIDVYAGSRVVSAAGSLEAVANGDMDCVHSSPALWTDRVPELGWFAGTPFGLGAAGHAAWFYGRAGKGEGRGEGLDLWAEACEPLNVYPLPMGDAGPRLLGWSDRAVASVDALAGLRAAMPGMAGRVLALAGVEVNDAQESASGPPLASLGAGRLDLVQSLGACDDAALGAPRPVGLSPRAHVLVASGFMPSRRISLLVNRESYNGMHPVLRRIVDAVAAEEDLRLTAMYARANAEAMRALGADPAVAVHVLDTRDVHRLRVLARRVAEAEASRSALAGRIKASMDAVQGLLAPAV